MTKPNHQFRSFLVPGAALLLPALSLAAVSVDCAEGCRPVTACAGNATPYLFCLADRSSDVKLTWRVDTPLTEGQSLQVYAGNPARSAGIPVRSITFTADQGAQVGSLTLKSDEVGIGALLLVTTLKSRDRESILSWLPYRTSTEAETRESLGGTPPAGSWSVDVVPAFVQVSAAWRELPRTRDSRTRTWLSLTSDPMLATDADLDGSVAGVPGLVMQVSAPWHAREDWKSKLQEFLKIPEKHAVKFESLHWEEKPDRVIEGIPGAGPISLRNYYTVVTLFTNASTATYAARDMGLSGNNRYFAHETSAALKQVDHPLLWASYAQNDYSSDNHLLKLLQEHVQNNGPSLELGPVQRVNGDGGPAVYRAAFKIRVRPWSDDTTGAIPQPTAGIVGVDVLAVRTGMGSIKVPASNATGVQSESMCSLFNCGNDDGLASIDFNKPPKGWEVSPPQSSALSLSNQIPLLDGIRSVAERDPDSTSGVLPKFPATAEFALAVSLQSGALVRRGGFLGRRVDGIVPINSYAQYIVRFAVATFPGQEMVTTDTVVLPSADQIGVKTITPKKKSVSDWIKDWVRENLALSGVLLLAAFLVVLFLVPGFRSLVSAVFGMIAAFIRKITPKDKPTGN
jgi:hypothetical protein